MTNIDRDKWYTIREVEKITGISKDTLIKRAKQNPEKWGFRLRRRDLLIWQIRGKLLKKWEEKGMNNQLASSKKTFTPE